MVVKDEALALILRARNAAAAGHWQRALDELAALERQLGKDITPATLDTLLRLRKAITKEMRK